MEEEREREREREREKERLLARTWIGIYKKMGDGMKLERVRV